MIFSSFTVSWWEKLAAVFLESHFILQEFLEVGDKSASSKFEIEVYLYYGMSSVVVVARYADDTLARKDSIDKLSKNLYIYDVVFGFW